MDKFTFNSGNLNTNNDSILLKVAMDPGSSSSILIRNYEQSGIINYVTDSDYVYELSRVSTVSGEARALDPSFSSNISYPNGISITPGSEICSTASSPIIPNSQRIPRGSYFHLDNGNSVIVSGDLMDDLSNLSDVTMDGVEVINMINPEEIFIDEWSVSGGLRVANLYSPNDSAPFIETENLDTSDQKIARINIYASESMGSLFEFQIQNDITSTGAANLEPSQSGTLQKIPEITPISLGAPDESTFIDEWNSIFSINNHCNVESEFLNGKNRDEVFIQRLRNYMDKNWEKSMKEFLWGDCITDKSLSGLLTTQDRGDLELSIYYQLYYYGTSDDIKILSEYKEQQTRLGKTMQWHYGLGGFSKITNKKRKLKQEYTYMPSIKSYRNIYKVYDMPPRAAFSSLAQNDEKSFNFIGEDYAEIPKAIDGFYPLFNSKNYAEEQGGGFSSEHVINGKSYYMPSGLVSGVTYFHGTYDPSMVISYLTGSYNEDEILTSSESYEITYTEPETGYLIEDLEVELVGYSEIEEAPEAEVENPYNLDIESSPFYDPSLPDELNMQIVQENFLQDFFNNLES